MFQDDYPPLSLHSELGDEDDDYERSTPLSAARSSRSARLPSQAGRATLNRTPGADLNSEVNGIMADDEDFYQGERRGSRFVYTCNQEQIRQSDLFLM